MKILFLNLYSGKIERGAESFAHSLADKLREKEFWVDFIKGQGNQVPSDGFKGNLVSKISKRFFLDKAGRAVLLFSLRQIPLIWKSNYDVIIPMNGFWQVLILKILQTFKGYKILITGHSGPGWDERWNLYLKPDVFVATTGPMKIWAQRTCSWTRVELIPYGIDKDWGKVGKVVKLDNFIENSLRNLERPIILCPSALVPYKRIDLAIKAVAKLKQGSLLVVGKGKLERELRKLGDELLPGRFLLTSVKYEHMLAIYHKVDLVTLPSSPQENSPMVFVEALACGKKVVATDALRVRWMLEGSGFYVDPADLKEYAAAIQKALNTRVDTSKSLEKFLWPSVLYKYHQVLKSLA